MPWHERALRAMQEAVAEIIAEDKRRGLPLAVWRNGKVVHISPEEAEAEFNAQRSTWNEAPGRFPKRHLVRRSGAPCRRETRKPAGYRPQ
jgi:hypothetical protein